MRLDVASFAVPAGNNSCMRVDCGNIVEVLLWTCVCFKKRIFIIQSRIYIYILFYI